jgi:hypothetical protein
MNQKVILLSAFVVACGGDNFSTATSPRLDGGQPGLGGASGGGVSNCVFRTDPIADSGRT